MQTEVSAVQSLHDRIQSLERRQRVMTGLCLAAAFVLPLAAFTWQNDKQAAPVAKEVRAESFLVVDGQGKTRAELSLNKDGSPQLLLNDSAGKSMVKLFINKDTESIGIFADKNGMTRVGIAVDGGSHPHVLLSDKGGKPRMQLAVSDQGAPSLICIDIDGYMNAGIGMHADGTTWIRNEKPASRPAGK